MIRILTSFKPFVGRACEIQTRSRLNWEALGLEVRDVQGVAGPPEFGDVLKQVLPGEVVVYSNGDILFEDGLETVVRNLPNGEFLAVGQRLDLFPDGTRRLHGPSGMDYFFFRGGMFSDLPRTIVGRAYYDSALVAWALRKKIPVIDLTAVLRVVHQWHDYGHVAGGRKAVFEGADAQANKLNNELPHFGPHIADATCMMTRAGKIVPNVRCGRLRKSGKWSLWNILTRGGRIWNRWWPW